MEIHKSSYKEYLWIKKHEYYKRVFDDYLPSQKSVVIYDINGMLLSEEESLTQASKIYKDSFTQDLLNQKIYKLKSYPSVFEKISKKYYKKEKFTF